jgi:hypothetical protein
VLTVRKVAAVGAFREDSRPVLLVLRALKLGDLLVAVPALHSLRRAYPGHRLLYAAQGRLEDAVGLVGGFELLPAHRLDEPLALEPGTVDVAVNLHGRGPESQSRIEALQANQIIAHGSCPGEGPAWVDGIHEPDRWARLLQWQGIDADPQDFLLNVPSSPTQWPQATIRSFTRVRPAGAGSGPGSASLRFPRGGGSPATVWSSPAAPPSGPAP